MPRSRIVRRALRAGFTLLELLLTLIILAILAGLAAPAYNGSVEKMKNVEALENLVTTRRAMVNYHAFYNSYSGATIPLAGGGNLDFNPNVTMTGNNALFRYDFSAGPTASTYTLHASRVVNWAGCAPRTVHIYMDEMGNVTYA